jgi:hypothetical protein
MVEERVSKGEEVIEAVARGDEETLELLVAEALDVGVEKRDFVETGVCEAVVVRLGLDVSVIPEAVGNVVDDSVVTDDDESEFDALGDPDAIEEPLGAAVCDESIVEVGVDVRVDRLVTVLPPEDE